MQVPHHGAQNHITRSWPAKSAPRTVPPPRRGSVNRSSRGASSGDTVVEGRAAGPGSDGLGEAGPSRGRAHELARMTTPTARTSRGVIVTRSTLHDTGNSAGWVWRR